MRETPSSLLGRNLYQIGSFVFSIISAVPPNSTLPKADSGTKTEVSHGECEDQRASLGCLSARPGVSCREEAVNLQQPPKPRLHPWDTSVFVPESRARGVLFVRRNKAPIEYQEDTEVLAYWSAVELACSLSLTARQRVRFNRQKRTRLKS